MEPCWKPGKLGCCGVSARDAGSMPGFGRGDPAILPSLGRGLLEGMMEFVVYMGFAKDGDALRIWLFCMASICAWACAWENWP